jgi:signal transduction histidine kinase
LTNAIKFTPLEGRVNVKAEKRNGSVTVSVSDTGVGMSEDKMQKLFRIDTKITSIGTNNEKGSGLGLILCKEFVERHKGRIVIESEQGNGSTFSIMLPA